MSSPRRADHYDVAMLDLDGVVYIGGEAIPGAADHLSTARETGLRTAFITNNASRAPEDVVALLRRLDVETEEHDVVTSAQAAARLLAERLGKGGRVALLGGPAIAEVLSAAGLEAVEVDAEADAVISGFGPDVPWRDVMRAAVRIRDGLWWVATNTDGTIPTSYGVAPGHGVLVDTLRRFSEVEPTVAGKPAKPLLEETIQRMSAEQPLMVGDRLDTDIAGARAVGVDSLLVMTGVTDLAELAAASEELRPTYVAADLGGLMEPVDLATEEGGGPGGSDGSAWRLGGWTAVERDGRIEVDGAGSTHAWWQVVAQAAWAASDAGRPVDVGALVAPDDATGR